MLTTRRRFLARLGAAGAALGLPPALPTRLAAQRAPAAESLDRVLAAARPGLPVVPAGALSRDFWHDLRAHFLLPRDHGYFNAGSLGASPRVVMDAVTGDLLHVEQALATWDFHPDREQLYAGYRPERALRGKLAGAMGCDADELALTRNATMGMNLVANGLDLGVGDEVLLVDGSHVGNRCGWELRDARHGVHVRRIPAPATVREPDELLALYERATGPRTRVWVVEQLTSATGVRYPVEALCRRARERGILTVVDGAQTAGHLVVDLHAMGCDAYFSSPHKWLLAPVGTGFLYVRREVQPRVWSTLASEHWDDHADGGFRLMQQGTANRSLLRGVDAALDVHLALGAARVEARALALADRLCAGLQAVRGVTVTSPRHPAMRTGTVLWQVAGMDAPALQERLWQLARVRVRAWGPAVRQCCHVYNLEEEIDRTVAAARRLAAG